jgi:HSP20 family protein
MRLGLHKPARRMDRFFEDFGKFWEETHRELTPFRFRDIKEHEWMPEVDVYETDENFVMKADLPGVKKEDIEIDMKENSLTIKAEKKFEETVKKEDFVRVEKGYGTYMRTFTVSDNMDLDHIKAEYKDGILELTIPKKEAHKKIEVKVN